MCSDVSPGPYLKGQGHMRHLKVRVHNACVRAITYSFIEALAGDIIGVGK